MLPLFGSRARSAQAILLPLLFAGAPASGADLPPVAAAGVVDDPGFAVAIGAVVVAAMVILLLARIVRERRQNARRMEALLQRADCMLWEARVVQHAGRYEWRFTSQPSGLFARLFSDLSPPPPGELWPHLQLDDKPEMDRRAEQAIASGARGYRQEFRVSKGDALLWLQERVTIDQIGPAAWHLSGVVTDVTGWRQAEATMRAKEAQVHQILARADCLLWRATVTQSGEQMQWGAFEMPTSGLYPRLFGDRDPSVGGKLWSYLKVPALAEMNARSRQALLSGATGYEQKFCAITETETFWLREKVSVTGGGAGCWHLVGVLTDVTAHHAAEVALAAEKDRLMVTLRAMADGVITTDTRGVVQFLNHAAARLSGHALEAATGRNVAELLVLHDTRGGGAVVVPVAQVVAADVVSDLPPRTELRDHTGGRRLVEGCCAPIHGADNVVIGTVFVFRDVTEREHLDQQLARASKLESVGVLAGGLAHDFNNILTVILGNLNLALLAGDHRIEAEQALREAERGALQARDLTQQLLTFAKGGDPVRAAVRLPDLLRQTAEFTMRGSRARCEFSLPGDLWAVDADKGQLGQVVQNLVLNAVQAMPEGGVIRLSARNSAAAARGVPAELPPGDYVHLAVADTGSGIPPEILPRVFDPYFSTKHRGSGLGLATVHSIVTKHRGRIDVQSVPGEGTIFNVWLPAAPHAVLDRASQVAAEEQKLQGRVLVMDDEEPILRLTGAVLRRIGFVVATVMEGREAVDRYRAAREEGVSFDLVIMDLTVPGGFGGREALQEMLTFDSGVRAIVSSGYSNDPVLANFRAYGFRGRIAKPFQLADFIEVVRAVLKE